MFVFGIIFKHKKVSSSYLWLALLTPPLVTLLIQNWAKIYHWSYIPGGEMILFNGLFVFFLILLLPKEQVLETNHYISGTESNHEE